MKTMMFLVALYILIPGSGRLVWDGLPLSTRAEFALLTAIVIAFASSEIRNYVRNHLSRIDWRGLLKPLLTLLCVAKFFTFAWSPMSAGFEACYRSIYNPLPNSNACEKSFEGPLLPGEGTGSASASRVDAFVDFGRHPYDWSLPFMNDYPRLGNLWLSRFPFMATYTANVSTPKDGSVLPVFSIGELDITVNGENAARAINYDRHTLTGVRLPSGTSEVVIRYSYSDDDLTVPPDTAPIPRGPYAALKIGTPLSLNELYQNSRILIHATTISSAGRDFPGEITVQDRNQRPVAYNNLNERPRQLEDEFSRSFDLEVEIPATSLLNSPLEVVATRNDSTVILGTISTNDGLDLETTVSPSSSFGKSIQLGASLTVDRDDLIAIHPDTRVTPSASLRILLTILDLVSLLIFGFLTLSIARTAGSILIRAMGLAGAAWLLIYPFDSLLPRFAGGGRELVIPYALLSLFVLGFRHQIMKFPLVSLLPVSTVLAAQKVFEHLYFNHPGEQENWWGKLIFLWRDSDWFANQGNARSILVEGSLRGGESVFWFRAAPRYLLALLHFLLGENDVLIGLVSLTTGFLVVWMLAAVFINRHESLATTVVGCFALFISLVFLGDQITTAFAFFVSSEYPTWLLFLGTTIFLLREHLESRIWVTSLLSALIAMTVQFRPNGLFVAFALLPLVVMKADRTRQPIYWKQVTWVVVSFVIVLSLSLIHNLFYGKQFVLFTPNPAHLYAVPFGEVLREEGVLEVARLIWARLRGVMYWHLPHDPNFAIFFWGSQFIFVGALTVRAIRGLLKSLTTLLALIPLTYVIPMLPFKLDSYYPRLLVSASLLCLCSGLLLWPKPTNTRTQ